MLPHGFSWLHERCETQGPPCIKVHSEFSMRPHGAFNCASVRTEPSKLKGLLEGPEALHTALKLVVSDALALQQALTGALLRFGAHQAHGTNPLPWIQLAIWAKLQLQRLFRAQGFLSGYVYPSFGACAISFPDYCLMVLNDRNQYLRLGKACFDDLQVGTGKTAALRAAIATANANAAWRC